MQGVHLLGGQKYAKIEFERYFLDQFQFVLKIGKFPMVSYCKKTNGEYEAHSYQNDPF